MLVKQQAPRAGAAPPPDRTQTAAARAERKPAEARPRAVTTTGDREQEAEEAKREMDEFLRRQRLLFRTGELQLEFAASYSVDSAENSCLGIGTRFCARRSRVTPKLTTRSANTSVIARYGLAENLEFDLTVTFTFVEQEKDFTPFDVSPRPSLERTNHVGFSDVAWALRYAAWREDGIRPDVVLSVNAKSRTGDEDRGLGTGNWNVGGAITLVKTIDPVVFFGGLGYTATLESEGFDPGDQIPYSLGMGVFVE